MMGASPSVAGATTDDSGFRITTISLGVSLPFGSALPEGCAGAVSAPGPALSSIHSPRARKMSSSQRGSISPGRGCAGGGAKKGGGGGAVDLSPSRVGVTAKKTVSYPAGLSIRNHAAVAGIRYSLPCTRRLSAPLPELGKRVRYLPE